MAVPRNRHSNARKNKRRSHLAKKPIQMASCNNCGAARLPHTICQPCGQYAGVQVLNVSSDSE